MRLAAGALMVGALATAALSMTPRAEAQTSLKVMVFPGLTNLPLFAAQSEGYFAKRGLTVEILNTPNSQELREGLAQGRHQIVHGGVDNAVAMAEMAKVDIAVVVGGDNGYNYLYAQPGISSYEDLRGKTVIVDAPNTAFALLLYKMLEQKGLKKGDYQIKEVGATHLRVDAMLNDKSNAASMLNPPFTFRADAGGLKNMGAAIDAVGPYQSGAGWVMRKWGQENADTLTRYLAAYLEGWRYAFNPANKAAMVKAMVERLKLPEQVASRAYDIATDAKAGYPKDAGFDMDGFRNVLKIRAETLGTWGGTPPAPDKYLDFSYYDRAKSGL